MERKERDRWKKGKRERKGRGIGGRDTSKDEMGERKNREGGNGGKRDKMGGEMGRDRRKERGLGIIHCVVIFKW